MEVGLNSVLVDRYELGPTLGRGGMAVVRAAHDRRLDRAVAVKIFDSAGWSTTEGRARFETEAQLAASVTHPNVVVVYDVGIDGDVPFLVMECLPGTTLADEIRSAPLTIPRTTEIAGAILDALGAAHERGVLHRDLKPANVLIAADGHAKLTDFGIATSDTLLELTAAGMVIGTPAYLAPERLAGTRATVRSDLYAVGIMIYEALAGARPFRGDTPLALAYAMQHTSPEALCGRRDDVPEMFEAVVMRSISRRPEDRFASAAEFAAALRTAADDRPVRTDEHATVAIAPITATQLMTTVSAPTAVTPAPSRHRARARGPTALAAALVIVALGIGIFAFAASDKGATPKPANANGAPTTATLPPSLQGPFDELQRAVRP